MLLSWPDVVKLAEIHPMSTFVRMTGMTSSPSKGGIQSTT